LFQPELVKQAMPVYHVHNNEDWQQAHGAGMYFSSKTEQIIVSSYTVKRKK